MELFYIYGICFSLLIIIRGVMISKEKKQYKGHYLYIKRYTPKNDRIVNKLLVIGLLRKFFGFKFFWYINRKVYLFTLETGTKKTVLEFRTQKKLDEFVEQFTQTLDNLNHGTN